MGRKITTLGALFSFLLLGCAPSVGGGWANGNVEIEIGDAHFMLMPDLGNDHYRMTMMGDVNQRGSAIDFTPTHVNECWCVDWDRQWIHLDDTDIDDDYNNPDEFEVLDPLRTEPWTVQIVEKEDNLVLEYPGGAQAEFSYIGNSAEVVDDGFDEELSSYSDTEALCDNPGMGDPFECGPLMD